MFTNATDVASVPMRWFRDGYGPASAARALSPLVWFHSTIAFAESLVELRAAPHVRAADDAEEGAWMARALEPTTFASAAWRLAPEATAVLSTAATAEFLGSGGDAGGWWHGGSGLRALRESARADSRVFVLHVYRLAPTYDGDFAGIAASAEAGLAALRERCRGAAKRPADDTGAREPDVVHEPRSLVLLCVNEAAFAALATYRLRCSDATAAAAVRARLNRAAAVMSRVNSVARTLFTRDVGVPASSALEPPIPRLDATHGLALTLFDHQRRTVHWMLRLEAEGRRSIVFRKGDMVDVCLPRTNATFTYRGDRTTLLSMHTLYTEPCALFRTFHVAGGLVCAPTGTGKTTCAIALMHLQRVLGAPAHADGAVVGGLYYTNATLIVAPRQVVAQWADEFEKTLVEPVRVRLVRTAADAVKLTLADVFSATDVVVMCKDIFASPVYRKLETQSVAGEANPTLASFHGHVTTYPVGSTFPFARLVDMNRAEQPNAPGMYVTRFHAHALRWRRLIIDEAHELDTRWTMIERAISTIAADVVWGLTATPNFTSHGAFSGVNADGGYSRLMAVPDVERDSLAKSAAMQRQFVLHAALTSTVANVPPLTMHRVAVHLCAQERAMYTSIASERTRDRLLYCSHHDAIAASDVVGGGGGSMVVSTLAAASAALGREHERAAAAATADETAAAAALEAAWERARTLLADVDGTLVGASLAFVAEGGDEQTCMSAVIEALAYTSTLAESAAPPSPAAIARHMSTRFWTPADAEANDEGDETDIAAAEASAAAAAALERAAKALAAACTGMTVETHIVRRQQRIALTGAREAVRAATKALEKAAAAARSARSSVTFFRGVFEDIENPGASIDCSICFDDERTRERIALTACGHRFCVVCASAWFAGHTRCPMCKHTLVLPRDLRNIERVAPAAPAAATGAAGAASDVDEHGSKLVRLRALLAFLLGAEPTTKVIVFAQFDRLLRLVERALTRMGIEVLTVRGSIHACQRTIERFRAEPTARVMLLSSDATISGISLVEANHVVAVHPPYDAADDVAREYVGAPKAPQTP